MDMLLRILTIHRDLASQKQVAEALGELSPSVSLCSISNLGDYLGALVQADYDLVIVEENLGWARWRDVLRAVKAAQPRCQVWMVTNRGRIEGAVEGIKAGLDHYFPYQRSNPKVLVQAIQNALPTLQGSASRQLRRRHLLENLSIGIYRISPEGFILDANPALIELLGFDSGTNLVRKILGEYLRSSSGKIGRAVYEEGELELRRVDGSTIWVENHARPVFGADGQIIFYEGSLADITARKHAEETLKRREAILSAISLAAEKLLKATDWHRSVPHILQILGEATHVSRVYVFENELGPQSTPLASLRYEWTANGIPPQLDNPALHKQSLEQPNWQRLRKMMLAGQAVYGPIEQFEPGERTFLEIGDTQSILLVPIFVGQELWGAVGFDDCRSARDWSAPEVEAVQAAANTLGAAIQRQRVEEALLSAEIQFRNLVEQALMGIYVLDKHGYFMYVNPRLAEISGYHPSELIGVKTIQEFIPLNDLSIIENMINESTPDDHLKIHYQTRAYRKDGIPVDIEVQGSRILFNGKPAIIGTVLDITERHLREQEMEAIISISSAMRSARSGNEIIPMLLNQLLVYLNAQASLLVLRDPISEQLTYVQGQGDWEDLTGQTPTTTEAISAYVISSGQSYLNGDVRSDPRMINADSFHQLYSAAVIPLIAQSQTIGALWIGGKHPFSDSQLRLLTAIGEIAANAIHRTSLNEQTELRLKRLTALRAIDMAITASLDVRVTLSILLGQVTTHLGIDAAAILLYNPFTQTLEYSAVRGFRTTAIQHVRQRLGEGHAGRVAMERQPVFLPVVERGEGCFSPGIMLEEGFQSYYALPLIAKGQVKGVLEIYHRYPMTADLEWTDFLQAIAAQAAIAIDNAELFDKLQRNNVELTLAYDATIEGWSRAMEMREHEEEGHNQRLVDVTLRLARACGIPETDMLAIRRGVMLHDAGIMSIPDSILLKPGPLTDEEWDVIRQHPAHAHEMLAHIPYLRLAVDIPYCHHEWWDGSGYPRGLKQNQIPLAARVFAVVDVWFALQRERPYRPAWTRIEARQFLRDHAGTQFDPHIVDTFLSLVEKANEL